MVSPPAEPSNGLPVLLVDDEDALRRVFRRVFKIDQRLDVVAEARDGNEAIARAREFAPAVILLDLRMPGMDGLEALPILRGIAPNATIVMLSMMQDPRTADRAIALGAHGFVDKTTEPTQLVDQVVSIHNRRGSPTPISADVAQL